MATIIDVAKAAGVSKSTVSRVVTGNGQVSKQAKDAVEAAVKKLGYRPNAFARGLKKSRSFCLGVVVPNISSPFYAQILSGVQESLDQLSMSLIVARGQADIGKEVSAVSMLLDRQVDGLLLYLENDIELDQIATEVPIVVMGRQMPKLTPFSIRIDNEQGGYLAAKHLIEKGHRNIVYLTGPAKALDTRLRHVGVMRAFKESNVSECRTIEGEYSEAFGHLQTLDLIKSGLNYTAILAGDDDIAAGIFSALREHSLQHEVSVVGYDDNFHARHMTPKLTTVRQPLFEIGKAAANLLVEVIEKKPLEKHLLLKPSLINRESVLPN